MFETNGRATHQPGRQHPLPPKAHQQPDLPKQAHEQRSNDACDGSGSHNFPSPAPPDGAVRGREGGVDVDLLPGHHAHYGDAHERIEGAARPQGSHDADGEVHGRVTRFLGG